MSFHVTYVPMTVKNSPRIPKVNSRALPSSMTVVVLVEQTMLGNVLADKPLDVVKEKGQIKLQCLVE